MKLGASIIKNKNFTKQCEIKTKLRKIPVLTATVFLSSHNKLYQKQKDINALITIILNENLTCAICKEHS